MRLWRLSKRATFDGEGARKYGGRWNHPGTPVIYTAASLALALLELLVHVPQADAPDRLVALYVDIPDDLDTSAVDVAELPNGWDVSPGPAPLRDIGTEWAVRRSSLVLAVPTAVLHVPRELIAAERNFLINPMHADFGSLRPQHVITTFDPRFFR